MKRKKKKVILPREAKATDRYLCPKCGWVKGLLCVKCTVAKRLEEEHPQETLEDGVGRTKRDPSPLEIKFRAMQIRKRRDLNLARKETKWVNGHKLWQNDPRIVRYYRDPRV